MPLFTEEEYAERAQARKEYDEKVYAWAKTQNRGIPPWNSISGSGQAMWRDRYEILNGHA